MATHLFIPRNISITDELVEEIKKKHEIELSKEEKRDLDYFGGTPSPYSGVIIDLVGERQRVFPLSTDSSEFNSIYPEGITWEE